MPDEFLLDPDEKFHIRLERAVEQYYRAYKTEPQSKSAQYWLDNPNFEEVLEEYFLGSGQFTAQDWERWITNIYEINIVPRGTGVWVTFEFEFDNGDDSPGQGQRSAYGRIS